MPVNRPPFGGAGRRRRNRLSGSSLVSWERCPRGWMVNRRLGLRGPVRPSMLLGILLEDAVVGLLMESPPRDGSAPYGRSKWLEYQGVAEADIVDTTPVESIEGIHDWLHSLVPEMADYVYQTLLQQWAETPWKTDEADIDTIQVATIRKQIRAGLKMQIETANSCLEEGGGPHLEAHRTTGDPHNPPAPRWDSSRGEKVAGFQDSGELVDWWEAWEVSRPWMKDPRINEPQRIHHPDGWASGEMDVVHRWRSKATIVDIKSGLHGGRPQPNLETQLRFYRWLWHQTREDDSQGVDCLEGWFLLDGQVHRIDARSDEEMNAETTRLEAIRNGMGSVPEQDWAWIKKGGTPTGHPLHCPHCDGMEVCGYSAKPDDRALRMFLPELHTLNPDALPQGSTMIGKLPSRICVKGTIDGGWTENENPYGEKVRVANLRVGTTYVVVEETESGVVDSGEWKGEVAIVDANPGHHRDRARLFLDGRSRLIDPESDEPWIRLGLIPSRATVSGEVVSIGSMSGTSQSGRPWSIRTLHLWDGSGVVEIAAFGSNRSRTFDSIVVGNAVTIRHGELGWREGAPQIKIGRTTSIESIER
ncbi:MAG: hypothetical protein CMA23_004640 [Methanobacteriota archaeon]|nr:MAG: hypothetical protein CMA23_004640 [Euryarchaeota archaeon]